MKIILLYTGSTGFPLGDAYTNRVLSIAKGLISIGCNIKIYIIYPGRNSGVKYNRGIYESVCYEYMTPLKMSKNSILKRIVGAFGVFKACLGIIFKDSDADAIISFAESSIQNNTISIVSHLKGMIYLRETNEYPQKILKNGLMGLSQSDHKAIVNSLKHLDGLLCISKPLKDYFQINISFNKPILIIPIIVDLERFSIKSPTSKQKYITYCGNIFGEKDGVEILVKAFAKIAPKYEAYKLKLIGDTNNNIELDQLLKLINSLGINQQVVFTGYIRREDIPLHLISSEILVLARPDNIQARGGFPTKLGEYLATANPVIVTSVGAIPNYLKDGVNAFLAKPGDINNLAEKIEYVIDNHEIAIKVGVEGYKLTKKEFNQVFQANRIKEFIQNIIQSGK